MRVNVNILSAIAVIMVTAGCKNDMRMQEHTPIKDSVHTESHKHGTDEHTSELMASMNDMMESMHNIEMTGNADHDLAAMMKEHHKSAVDMADILLDKGSDAKLKSLAQKIKDEQDNEIDGLQKIQNKYKDAEKNYDPENSQEGLGKAMMDDMMTMMKMPASGHESIDKEFAIIMIKHHQDGIKMARSILKFSTDAEFKKMASSMIASQQQDVKAMEQFLADHP